MLYIHVLFCFSIREGLLPSLLLDSKELDSTFAGYSEKLTDITLYLLSADHETENFIGFVNWEEDKEDETVKESNYNENKQPNTNHNTELLNNGNHGKSKKTSAVKQ